MEGFELRQPTQKDKKKKSSDNNNNNNVNNKIIKKSKIPRLCELKSTWTSKRDRFVLTHVPRGPALPLSSRNPPPPRPSPQPRWRHRRREGGDSKPFLARKFPTPHSGIHSCIIDLLLFFIKNCERCGGFRSFQGSEQGVLLWWWSSDPGRGAHSGTLGLSARCCW